MIGKAIVVLISLVFSISISAQTKVLLSSSQKDIQAGDIISAQIIIEGETDAEIERIENIELFNIEGQSTSSSFKFINGQSSKEKTISYELSLKSDAKKEVYLGPVIVSSNGKELKSNYLIFNVVQGHSAAKGNKTKTPEPNYYFLDVQVEKENLFVNQKTLLTLKFYNAVEFAEANLVTPDSKDFWLEQHGKQQNSREIINGKAYKVTTVKYFFTPLVSGSLSLDGFAINGLAILPDKSGGRNNRRQRLGFGFDSFFEDSFFRNRGKRRRVNLKATPLDLIVKDLPGESKESGFDGIVGQFKIKELDYPSEISSQDSIMFSFVVSGDGNLNLLEFIYDSKDFKVYKDKDESVVLPGGDLQEARKLTYLLIPQKNGSARIPEFRAKYFDPHDKLFKELLVGGTEIKVNGSLPRSNETEASLSRQKNAPGNKVDVIPDTPEENFNEQKLVVLPIAEKSTIHYLISWLNVNSQVLLYICGFVSFVCMFFHLMNQQLFNAIKRRESGSMKKNILRLKSMNGNFASIGGLDDLLAEIMREDYSPVRGENFDSMKRIGVQKESLEIIKNLYFKCESNQFSKVKKDIKYSGDEINSLIDVVKKIDTHKRG